MPLKESSSPGAFKWNLKELVKAGHKINQSLAIAYAKRREAQAKGK